MLKTHLAPGFRFHPTDVELVNYYLKRKVMGKKLRVEAIAEIEIYKFEPSDLPDKSYLRTGDLKWYFFCPRGKKYASGVRTNRATEFGYWKTTGKERDVLYNNEVVGKIKTLVYHCGKAPRGERTDWVMHEYRLEAKELAQMDVAQDAYVLCVVFKKDGPGPRNGAQYGAPFKEEEWSDGDDETNNVTALPSADGPIDLPGPSLATTSHARNDILAGMISESCVSDVAPNAKMPLPLSYEDNTLAPILDSNSTPISAEATQTQTPGDDLCSMLDFFVEDERLCFGGYPRNETRHNSGVPRDGELHPLCLEADDVFSGLPDLGNFDHVPGTASYHYNCNATENSSLFLELEDLTEPLTVPIVQSENLGNRDSIFQMQDQFGSSSDLSCFATTRHGTLSSQSQSKSTHPFSGDLK